MAFQDHQQSDPVVRQEVQQLLHDTPSFRQLDATTQAALSDSMTKVASFLSGAAPGLAGPLASQLAPPDLQRRLSPQGGQSTNTVSQPQPTAGRPVSARSGPAPSGATGRAAEVARATLNAIDFPEFVASLIKGTFQAIVDASIQQMEAYAELIKNVALTIDQFMEDNISEDVGRDYLADRYEGLFTRDTSSGQPQLNVNRDAVSEGEMPGFFKDLGFDSPDDIDQQAMDQVIIPQTRRTLAEQRQQMLATMVLMGINRVVVDEGEIKAKLQFHVDASESTELRFDQTKTTAGNLAGTAAKKTFAGNAIMVNTASLNAQSDINVRTDLTGEVKVLFRSETFPLERFADSAAIQLINSRANVPQPAAALPGASSEPQDTAPSVTVTPADSATPPASQSLAYDDPWAPRQEQ